MIENLQQFGLKPGSSHSIDMVNVAQFFVKSYQITARRY